ncbi:MAG: hypothetical protein QOF74_8802 [Caballeronia mineralivorans]|jgi:hypothetical protein|nr:hypothetical protein [Caballeronia mineralivorans]
MRTRENTRKCVELRDKQKWMNARIVRGFSRLPTLLNDEPEGPYHTRCLNQALPHRLEIGGKRR